MVALDVDATLEHVRDPQNTVKVQVGQGVAPQSFCTDFVLNFAFNFSTPLIST